MIRFSIVAVFCLSSVLGRDLAALQKEVLQAIQKSDAAAVTLGGEFSGVIVSAQGHVLTAHHTIHRKSYVVYLQDGRRFKARVLNSNVWLDTAVLKIDRPQNLPVATLGWGSEMLAGDPCISISAPGRGFKGRGRVIRLGRVIEPMSKSGFLHNTCLMEPGDSGGPLFDLQGRLIGVHSRIKYGEEENYEVPVDTWRRFWHRMIRPGRLLPSDAHSIVQFGFEMKQRQTPREKGLYEYGPLAVGNVRNSATGIEEGDVITHVAGIKVHTVPQLLAELFKVYTLQTGTVEVALTRNDKVLKRQLKVPAYQDTFMKTAGIVEVPPGPRKAPAENGAYEKEVQALSKKFGRYVVQVVSQRDGKPIQTLGTLVLQDQKRCILTQRNRVGTHPEVLFPDGRKVKATVFKSSREWGFALLTAPGDFPALRLPEKAPETSRGHLLISPLKGKGLLSIWGSTPFSVSKGDVKTVFIGIRYENKEERVLVTEVYPGSPAAGSGMKPGDIITAVNGGAVTTRSSYWKQLGGIIPGERITVSYKRGNQTFTKQMRGTRWPVSDSAHPARSFPGGASDRTGPYPVVVCHDAVVRPDDCGGPVFNIRGEWVGINMARYSRTQAFFIPLSGVRKFLDGIAQERK